MHKKLQKSASPTLRFPKWNGNLRFRGARIRELRHLCDMYEVAWGIPLPERKLSSMIAHFPEGQIVGISQSNPLPVSMVNIMLTPFDPCFKGGYEAITGNKTFSTHMRIGKLLTLVSQSDNPLVPVAYCVSIVADKRYWHSGYARETLKYAIAFAELNRVYATPFSAPRSYGKARQVCPGVDFVTYLHMSRRSKNPYSRYLKRIAEINSSSLAIHNITRAFKGEIHPLSEEEYTFYQKLVENDALHYSRNLLAFRTFQREYGQTFEALYGRPPVFEDFILLTGRKPMDETMNVHIVNGARFIRDPEGDITAYFEHSRTEDRKANGMNIILAYGYHTLFGHPVEDLPLHI